MERCTIMPPSSILPCLNKIDYIKCDVEGYEHNIIPLILKLLGANRPIFQIEIAQNNGSLINNQLKNLGYAPYLLSKNKLINLSKKNLHDFCDLDDIIFLHFQKHQKIISDLVVP